MEQYCQDKVKIAIVGGGPAGIYCALQLIETFKQNNFVNYQIDIFDKAPVLRTILPTGNLRCNITNSIYDIKEFASNYPRGEKFLYSIFSKHSNYDSIEYFKSIGIETYVQEDGRFFPTSNSSKDVKEKMLDKIFLSKKVKLIHKEILSKDELNKYDKVVISTGSRGKMELVESFGHKYKKFSPVLCALNIQNNIYPQGVSVKSLDGDFVFTDKGISGPLAFKISSINLDKKMPYEIVIRLFEFNELLKLTQEFPKKSIGILISKLIPKSLTQIIVKDFYKNACEISKKELESYCNLKLTIISKAKNGEIVNAGGILLNDIDKNCKSKIQKNLWFCGEILDIDGFCGGFNLQNCWSTAFVVANDIAYKILQTK